MAVPIDGSSSQQQRQQTELQNCGGAIGDIANLLGEADDLDLELVILELISDLLFQNFVIRHVVEVLPAGIELVELGGDHRTALIAGHQGADKAALGGGAGDSVDYPLVETLGRHSAGDQGVCTKAFLGNLVDEGVGRPQ